MWCYKTPLKKVLFEKNQREKERKQRAREKNQ